MADEKKQQHFPEQDYVVIRINSLHPSEPVPFDIFIEIGDHKVHYLRSGDSLTAEKLRKFEDKAPDSFYIKTENRELYRNYIQDRLRSEQLNPSEKAVILRESSLAIVQDLFESPDIGQALSNSKEVITNFINFMDDEPSAMAELLGLSKHDFYTFNHSLDVSIYSLGLGSVLGYTGPELKELGEGALFHDIGKRHVNIDIITKDGPLTDLEWSQMKKHPEYGLLILNQFDDTFISNNIRACCFEHHESFLGNGYPQSLAGDEIHPMARIVALTDTFDALTTKRSYNEPMLPHDALNFIKEKLRARYDRDVLEAMYSILFKLKAAS
ncbi:MAG: HD domain-containing protein [Bdellovibrionaceae bacterium]|nr:HD domain-containing protein [Pseudobdellovibrionaceae bacterium]